MLSTRTLPPFLVPALVAALLGCGLPGCGGQAPDAEPAQETSEAGAPKPAPAKGPARPQREYVDLVFDAPTMVCRVNCPKRISHAVHTQKWASRVRPDFYKKELRLRGERSKIDMAALHRELRRAGYPVTLKNAADVPKELAAQTFTPPSGETLAVEISGWSKMAGCSTRTGGPQPQAVLAAVEALVRESGYVEMNLLDDTLLVHLSTPGEHTVDEIVETVETTGAKARAKGDRSKLPMLVQGALFRAEGKRPVVLEFSAKTCLTCRRMAKTTLADQQVVTRLKEYEVVKLDTETHGDLVEYFNVTGTPTILVLDKKGGVAKRLVGFQTVESILEDLPAP